MVVPENTHEALGDEEMIFLMAKSVNAARSLPAFSDFDYGKLGATAFAVVSHEVGRHYDLEGNRALISSAIELSQMPGF